MDWMTMSLEARNLAYNNVAHVGPAYAAEKRDGWIAASKIFREQRPQPALIRPRRVDHAGRYAPPRGRSSSFHFYRMLQNAGAASTDHIQRPSRSPRATSTRTTSKNIWKPAPTEG